MIVKWCWHHSKLYEDSPSDFVSHYKMCSTHWDFSLIDCQSRFLLNTSVIPSKLSLLICLSSKFSHSRSSCWRRFWLPVFRGSCFRQRKGHWKSKAKRHPWKELVMTKTASRKHLMKSSGDNSNWYFSGIKSSAPWIPQIRSCISHLLASLANWATGSASVDWILSK